MNSGNGFKVGPGGLDRVSLLDCNLSEKRTKYYEARMEKDFTQLNLSHKSFPN